MSDDLVFWREGLQGHGVETNDVGAADLVVASAGLVAPALESRPRMVLAHGDASGVLERAGYACRTYFPIPSAAEPRAWLPLDDPTVCAYALRRWTVASTRAKRIRNEVLSRLIGARRTPLRSSWVTVGAASDPVPWFVDDAAGRVDVQKPAWLLTVGVGDSLDYRGVFHLFAPDRRAPEWVVKFARARGRDETFERDRAGLAVAARAGPVVAAHAPEPVTSFEHDGMAASVETAGPGAALSAVLRSNRARRSKLRLVERVASWIAEVGAATATAGTAAGELDRIGDVVVPEWRGFGLQEDLVDTMGDVPGVLQHNDLWSENVIVDDDSFMVVDWEDARPGGLPLWDLVYFLADALALLDGAYDTGERHRHFVSLFKGNARSSGFLFDWVRKAVAACSIPPRAVGSIVTACWLSQVLTHVTRGEDAERFADHGLSSLPEGEQWATLWLADPDLGPGWSAWRP